MAGTTYPAVRTELPGPRSRQLLERLDRVLISSLTDHDEVPFVEARKSDWVIDDVDGNTFADHVSAWGTTQLGATPRSVLRAVQKYGPTRPSAIRAPTSPSPPAPGTGP